jgi:branched-chain amino acid transport system substrate-binding protein
MTTPTWSLMAMAHAKDTSGTAIKDNIRKITQGGGKAVDNAVDGLKAIAAGEKVDYTGASGPCDFNDMGDILDASSATSRSRPASSRW